MKHSNMRNSGNVISFPLLINVLLVALLVILSSISLLFFSTNEVVALIPIAITALFIIRRIILIIFRKIPTLDIWAIFTYTSILIFIYSPLYHLITHQPIANNLPSDFTNLIAIIAWTSLPVIPLFYFGGYIRKNIKWRIKKEAFKNKEIKVPNISFIALVYILVGFSANIIIESGIGLGVLTGTLYVLNDFFSVGLIFLYFNWASKVTKKGKNVKFLGLIYLLVIVVLISLFNLDRGSRFFILVYAFWGLHIYVNYLNKKFNITKLIVITIILIPLLTQYKLFKYSEYSTDYLVDSNYRESIQNQYEQLTPGYTIATDLGRYYIWMLYYKELQPNGNIDYQHGKTYVDAALTMLPSWIVPNKPPGMIALSHDAESGRGFYEQYRPTTAKIGGFWAESYVNFGFLGIWTLAIIFGYFLELINEVINRNKFGSITPVVAGLLVTFGAEFLLHDSRLILWHVTKDLFLIFPLIIYIKFKKKRFNA
ncbi:O-antigen polysaccharide polymerase Wzy [Bacillus cereus group sp. MYBK222-1]|uniref:O-antigen polysaccharide polymerase Wzy n=1 Tax=Bacillus cereus group TaxID=86661 RepID=UPI001E51F102|nr:O-antigen polysaccharide polymerase Wzy [Bacillus paranthracis]MCC2373557.1 O-antigen polysaccharide polymerase Wzy [Bacillus paranthracis]